jgi:adenylate cyclase
MELSKEDAAVLTVSGLLLAHMGRDLDNGLALTDRAIALNTNLAAAWYWGGWLKIWAGEPNTAIDRITRAVRLSPLDPSMPRMQNGMAHAHFWAGQYDEAASYAAIALRDFPDFHDALRISAASNVLAGRLEEAQGAMARLRRLDPTLRVSTLREIQGPYRRLEDHDRYEEALRKAGLPE